MTPIEERMTVLETEFRTELKHLATKTDIAELRGEIKALETRLMLRLGGLMVVGFGAVIAVMRLWQ